MFQLVAAVTASIVTSAMCSLFEAVLYSVPVSHIEALTQQGNRAGRILKKLRSDVDRPISAILSLNTIANTAGAAFAGAAAATLFGEQWLVAFSAAFTLAILILAEVVPKTAGVLYSRPLAVLIAVPLRLLVWVFMPLVWLCGFVTRLVFPNRTPQTTSDEELIVMARLGLQTGTIDAGEMRVIENILKLEKKTAGDVLTPRSVMTALDHTLSMREVRDEPGVLVHSRLPVYGKTPDDIIGIALRRDILVAGSEDQPDVRLSDVMSPAHFVSAKAPLNTVLQMFLDRRQHMFVVVDEHGGTAGVLTLEDIIEEILGQEIVDEFDEVEDKRELSRRRRKALLEQKQTPGHKPSPPDANG